MRLPLLATLLLTAFIKSEGQALADIFPSKPVHFIVGYAPGGGTDALARIFSSPLSAKWHQPIIVENKPGSSGAIGADLVAHAAPDGYTVGWTANGLVTMPSLAKLNFDPVTSFSAITEVAYVPDVLVVNPSLQIRSLRQLIALAKSMPGKLNFSSSGIGASSYLQMKLLMQMYTIDMVHVPYTGGAAAVSGLLGDETQLRFAAMPSVIGSIRAGKLRAIAISSHNRSPALPDVPTVAEALGLSRFEGADSDWTGVVAPVGTPLDIITKVMTDIRSAAESAEVQKGMENIGFVTVVDSPKEFAATIKSDMQRWAPFVRDGAGK